MNSEQHPAWCARGADCGPDRHNRIPEHRSAPLTVPADPGNAGGVLYGYRVALSQVGDEPPVVVVEDGLPEAFDETARWAGLSLAQARQLAALLANLADLGGEVR